MTEKKDTPFKYSNSINAGQAMPVGEDYNKFLTARGFSYHLDTVLMANEVNKYPNMDSEMHYRFLFGAIRPAKRWSKWWKPEKHSVASVLSAYYQISMAKAYEISSFFTSDEIKSLQKELDHKNENK